MNRTLSYDILLDVLENLPLDTFYQAANVSNIWLLASMDTNLWKMMKLLAIRNRILNLDPHEQLKWACKNGHLELAKWLCQKFSLIPDNDLFVLSCRHGHLNIIEWIIDNLIIVETDENLFNYACESKNVKTLDWFCSKFNIEKNNESFKILCKTGCLKTVQWYCEKFSVQINDLQLNNGEIIRIVSAFGYVDVFEWFFENFSLNEEDIRIGFITSCCNGKQDLAKYIYNNCNIPIPINVLMDFSFPFLIPFSYICGQDDLLILEWLDSIFHFNANHFVSETHSPYPFLNACKGGQLHVLIWIYLKFPQIIDLVSELMTCIGNSPFYCACEGGNFKVIEWIMNKFEIDQEHIHDTFGFLCFHVQLYKVVKWMFRTFSSIRTDKNVIIIAIRNACRTNNLKLAQYIYHRIQFDIKISDLNLDLNLLHPKTLCWLRLIDENVYQNNGYRRI